MPSKIRLSFAVSEYDHVRDISNGGISVEGVDLNVQVFPVQDIFSRFVRFREWEISEMSFGMYVSLLSQGDASLTAIPVFLSRLFRQSAFFVRRDGCVRQFDDLKGRRIGFPDWSHTAGIYARGFLTHECGVRLQDVEWVQAGVNAPGHVPQIRIHWPEGVVWSSQPSRSLNDMLLRGEVDAVLSSHTPRGALGEDAPIVRLHKGGMASEAAYFQRTGIFPIMHVVAVRADVYERHPWAARNLALAFEAAKRQSLARMRDTMISRYPFPWMSEQIEQAEALFGEDIWPYGLAANRPTLEAFLTFCREQGVAHRTVAIEELFCENTMDSSWTQSG